MIAEYVGNMREDHAKVKMEEVMRYFNSTHFTWVQNDR